MDAAQHKHIDFHSYLSVWPRLLLMTCLLLFFFKIFLVWHTSFKRIPCHVYLEWLSIWTGWKTIHSDRQQQVAAHNHKALPSSFPLTGEWFVSTQLLLLLLHSVWEEFLFFLFKPRCLLAPAPQHRTKLSLPSSFSSVLHAQPHISSSGSFCLGHLAATPRTGSAT